MARIALIGLPGSGKSTLGPPLGAALDSPFLDMDSLLEESSGWSPREWVESHGWETFRSAESIVLAALDRSFNHDAEVVVGCGGGVVETASNVEILENWKCVWLDAPDQVLLQRTEWSNRPQHPGENAESALVRMRESRSPKYLGLGGEAVDTSQMSPEQGVVTILSLLGEL